MPPKDACILQAYKFPAWRIVLVPEGHVDLIEPGDRQVGVELVVEIAGTELAIILRVQVRQRTPRVQEELLLGVVEGIVDVPQNSNDFSTIIEDARVHQSRSLSQGVRDDQWSNLATRVDGAFYEVIHSVGAVWARSYLYDHFLSSAICSLSSLIASIRRGTRSS